MMLAITLFLFHLDRLWMIGAFRWDDLPATSALGLMALLDAPALWIWRLLSMSRASWILPPGVGISLSTLLFWSWVGLHLDRRRQRDFEPILSAVWLRAALYALAIAVSLLFLYAGLKATIELHGLKIRLLWECMISRSPKRILLGREITDVAYVLWGTVCVAYCTHNLWRDTTQWKRARQEARSRTHSSIPPL
jgi:hypothetical protein